MESMDVTAFSWFRVEASETAPQAFTRLFLEMANSIDKHGTDRIASAIEKTVDFPEHRLLIEAFNKACLRRRTIVLGVDSECQILFFPIIMRSPVDIPLPELVGDDIAEAIQADIHTAFKQDALEHCYAIPCNRLYSSIQFSTVDREFMHQLLCYTTEGIRTHVEKNAFPHVVEITTSITDEGDDELITAQGMSISFRLLPILLITPVGKMQPDALSNKVLLERIGAQIALCSEPNVSNQDLDVHHDSMSPLLTRVLGATQVEHAELHARTLISVESIILEAALAKAAMPTALSSATILIDKEDCTVDLNFMIKDEKGVYAHHLSIAYPYGYSAHSLAALLAASFTSLDYDNVVTRSTDSMPTSYGIRCTLH